VGTIVGIDVGTTGVKAIAIDDDGRLTGRVEEPYPLLTPQPGWAEQDPETWWAATEAALGKLGTKDLAGIGVSGQMHGLVALDHDRQVVRPAILWNDQRTARECAEIEETLTRERMIALTGNQALTGFTAPKLLWMRTNEPDEFNRIAHVLLPKDHVRMKLTGDLATDVSDASGTLLFNVGARAWSTDVIDELKLDAGWLPPAMESVEAAGTTAAGIPVAAGAGDQAAGALGVGVVEPGTLSIALGTSGVVFAALPGYKPDAEARVHVFCHSVPGTWHAMGVMLSAAGSLRWLRDALGAEMSFEELLNEAGKWEPGTEGAVFLPYLAGERTPHNDPDARASFTGLSLRHDRGALVRAVLEGVAYGLRDSLELLRDLGVDAERARVSGGGAKGRLWLEIIASVLDIPLELTAVEEGAAYGAALLGGIASGTFRDVPDAVARAVTVTSTVEPVDAWRDAYEEGYARFRSLYPALRGAS
jgi:xylulokinase